MKAKKEINPIEYFLEADYPVTVYRAPEGGYVAEVEDLPGCITEGETLEEVFEKIEETRRDWIEIQHEEGEEIPLPRTDQQYSGKFLVRIPKALHRLLAEQAIREGVSLNQYVEVMLTKQTTLKEISNQFDEKLRVLFTKPYALTAVYPWKSHYNLKREQEFVSINR